MKKRHGEEILSKVCAIEVCKPEVCCADLESKLSFPATAQTSFRRVRKAIYFFAFYASLGTSWMDKIMRSLLEAQHDPIIPCFLSYAVLFELAMAASCNFLSYLSSDNVVTKNIAVDRLIELRSGKMRRGDNFVKTFRWKTTIKPKTPCQVETLINVHCSDSFMFSPITHLADPGRRLHGATQSDSLIKNVVVAIAVGFKVCRMRLSKLRPS